MADTTDIAAAAAAAVANASPGVNGPAATPPTTAGTPWFQGVEADVLGHLQTKGWDKLTPAEAMAHAVKANRDLEKHFGTPVAQIARVPTGADDKEGWAALNARLGVPADKAGYDFSAVKFADGSELTDDFVNPIRDAVHAAGLRPDQAANVVASVVKIMDQSEANEALAKKGAIEADLEKLRAEWGANFETNDHLVGRALTTMGAPPEALNSMKDVMGVHKTMSFFLNIAKAMGEAKFIEGTGTGVTSGIITPEQAAARMADIKNDPDWSARWRKGGVAERTEFDMLSRRIVEGRMARRA